MLLAPSVSVAGAVCSTANDGPAATLCFEKFSFPFFFCFLCSTADKAVNNGERVENKMFDFSYLWCPHDSAVL